MAKSYAQTDTNRPPLRCHFVAAVGNVLLSCPDQFGSGHLLCLVPCVYFDRYLPVSVDNLAYICPATAKPIAPRRMSLFEHAFTVNA